MALFKKKEVINDTKKIEANDVVSDYGLYINNNTNDNGNLNFSSFESNFNEDYDEMPNLIEKSSTNEIQNSVDLFTNQNNDVELPINTNVVEENTNEQLYKPINDINNDYNFNPIMNNIENIPKNIENSRDINDALSELNGLKPKDEIEFEKERLESQFMNYDIDNNFEEFDVEPGFIRCPVCGQKIREDYKECFMCGAKLKKNTKD